jgi:hypothetical protein
VGDVETQALAAIEQRKKHGFTALLHDAMQDGFNHLGGRYRVPHDFTHFEPAQAKGITAQFVLHEEPFGRESDEHPVHGGVMHAARFREFAHPPGRLPGSEMTHQLKSISQTFEHFPSVSLCDTTYLQQHLNLVY